MVIYPIMFIKGKHLVEIARVATVKRNYSFSEFTSVADEFFKSREAQVQAIPGHIPAIDPPDRTRHEHLIYHGAESQFLIVAGKIARVSTSPNLLGIQTIMIDQRDKLLSWITHMDDYVLGASGIQQLDVSSGRPQVGHIAGASAKVITKPRLHHTNVHDRIEDGRQPKSRRKYIANRDRCAFFLTEKKHRWQTFFHCVRS